MKFVAVLNQSKRYKLYTLDIKMVYMKTIRKAPAIPKFHLSVKSDDDETEELILSTGEANHTLPPY
jgi:hypothetical protein